ncbi:MAG: rhodanese-like domain-containing protein [Candidatus Moranbacteria bacterium]|nr:rhodanese-like domain-containing protein [Candidatus Moranbacteria bacterium]
MISKESLVILIGFILIIIVTTITVIRSDKKETSEITAIESNQPQYKTISQENIRKILKEQNNPITIPGKKTTTNIIDVRSRAEFDAHRIAGAINIPAETLTKEDVEKHSADTIVIIPGNTPKDILEKITTIFQRDGFQDVYVMEGNMQEWTSSGGKSITTGDPDNLADALKIITITQEEARKWIEEDEKMIIIDTRNNQSFKQGHLIGAKNYPLNTLEEKRTEIPIGRKILIYGATESDTFQSGIRMHDLGFLSTKTLEGGFGKWQENNMPWIK